MSKARHQAAGLVVDTEVIRNIRQHARSSIKTEVCGLLIGNNRDGAICVEACIRGANAEEAGSHVTFTQETWEHVYRIKDRDFPNGRIVGWYHSHPGFGVFLSDHDTFIHKNFFSSPDQVAWVYDPHSDEEGCFGWTDNQIQRIAVIRLSDRRGGEPANANPEEKPSTVGLALEEEDIPAPREVAHSLSSHATMPWTVTILTHLSALIVGFVIGWYLLTRLLLVAVPIDPQTSRPAIESGSANSSGNSGQSDPSPSPNANSKQSAPNASGTSIPGGTGEQDVHTRQ